MGVAEPDGDEVTETGTVFGASTSAAPGKVVSQECSALSQRCKAIFEGTFEGAVFDFDADGAAVATVGQLRKESAPIDVAHAGQLGSVIAVGVCENADLIEPVVIKANVFGVNMEQAVAEVSKRCEIIHVLPDHV